MRALIDVGAADLVDLGRAQIWDYRWPSGLVLADRIARARIAALAGRAVIELGCGRGDAGLAAAAAGARVTFSDAEPDAVARALAAARGLDVHGRVVDWRHLPAELAGRFDVVLGADVTYDRAAIAPLLAAIDTLLAPDGVAWLADPDRIDARALAATGLAVTHVETERAPPAVATSDHSESRPVHVYRVSR